MKKYIFCFLLFLLVIAIVSGEGIANTKTISVMIPEHWKVAESITRDDWDAIPNHRRWFSDRVKEFMFAYPDIKIEFESLGWDQIASNFVIRSIAKDAPDISLLDIKNLPQLATGGYLEPLDSFDSGEWNDVIDGTLEAITISDHVYLMPFYHGPTLLYYNKKMFADAEIDGPPTTWKELIEYAIKLTKKDSNGKIEQYGFGSVSSNIFVMAVPSFIPYVWSQGRELSNKDGHAIFNSPEMKEALQLYVDLVHKYKAAPATMATWDKELAYDAFAEGLVAITTGSVEVYSVSKTRLGEENVGFARFPVKDEGDTQATFIETFGLVMSSAAENKEAAWEFIKFMGANETLYKAAKLYSGVGPSRKSAADHPVYKATPINEFVSNYVVEAGRPLTNIKEIAYWWDLLGVAMQEAVLQRKTVEKALNDAQVSYDTRVK